jgi:hypothetical protein
MQNHQCHDDATRVPTDSPLPRISSQSTRTTRSEDRVRQTSSVTTEDGVGRCFRTRWHARVVSRSRRDVSPSAVYSLLGVLCCRIEAVNGAGYSSPLFVSVNSCVSVTDSTIRYGGFKCADIDVLRVPYSCFAVRRFVRRTSAPPSQVTFLIRVEPQFQTPEFRRSAVPRGKRRTPFPTTPDRIRSRCSGPGSIE